MLQMGREKVKKGIEQSFPSPKFFMGNYSYALINQNRSNKQLVLK